MANRILNLDAPPAFSKASVLNAAEQGLLGECRQPGDIRMGKEINEIHYMWVTEDPGCEVNLPEKYRCSVESVFEHLPGMPITFWIIQPPDSFVEARKKMQKYSSDWTRCTGYSEVTIQTSQGEKQVTARTIDYEEAAKKTSLGKWYKDPANAHFLWTFKSSDDYIPQAEISDFFRIQTLQLYGGLYMDLDYVILSPKARYIEDGAGREFGSDSIKRLGAHAVANSFLKFSKGNPVLDDFAADMMSRMHDAWALKEYGYFGMATLTRVYLDNRFKQGCSGMSWTAYGRETIFNDACTQLDNMLGMHSKLDRVNNDTCVGSARAFQQGCPVAFAEYDKSKSLVQLRPTETP